MPLVSIFAATCWLLVVAQCVPHNATLSRRVPKNMRPSPESWEMIRPSGSSRESPVWVAHREYGEMDDIEDLYLEASKGFNWAKKQTNCLTSDKNLLVAAYFDWGTKSVFLGTIPRGNYYDLLKKDENFGQVWRAHYNNLDKNRQLHAEDTAYLWREIQRPFNLPEDVNPLEIVYGSNSRVSSKVAVWGIKGTDKESVKTANGRPYAQCPECAGFATEMGVFMEPPS